MGTKKTAKTVETKGVRGAGVKGLRGKQIDFLKALSKTAKTGPVPRSRLCELAKAHPTNVTANALGYVNPESRAKREAEIGYKSLLGLGYVKIVAITLDGDKEEDGYVITASGKAALAKAE